jgi:1-acyl-sn-glycerol-3-phosphate acyltransferase
MLKFFNYLFGGIIFLCGVLLESLFCIFPAWILRLFHKDDASFKMFWKSIPLMGNFVCFLLWIKVHVEGKEHLPKEGTANICYVSNHESIIEFITYVGPMHLKMIPIAKAEIARIPFIASLTHGAHTILIERSNMRSSIKAIQQGVDTLKSGQPVIIFPSGTRSKDGSFGVMKEGSFKMPFRAESTIVPLVVRGSRQCLEDKKGWHRNDVYVKVLPPIETKGLDREGQKATYQKIVSDMETAFYSLPKPRN